MKINKLLTPYNHNPGTTDRIKYIVIHYVGALGGAKANCQYYAGGSRGASAHYFLDFDGSIWQSVEDRDIAWHCGAKTYRHPECRNANSIGIELCVRNSGSKADTSRDWYFEDATVASAIQLTRKLMAKYGVPADHVIRHYDVTGKICPNPYVYNHTAHTWDEFKAAISADPEEEEKKSGWQQEDGGWRYYLGNTGEPVRNDWHEDPDGSWYWFDGAGMMVTEAWKTASDGRWYYLGVDGKMVKNCVLGIGSEAFAFGSDGAMLEGNLSLQTNERGALQYPGLAN